MSITESVRKMSTNEMMCYEMGYQQGRQDAVKHGFWKGTFGGMAVCSVCHLDQYVECFVGNAVQKFCGRCGAMMDGNETNEEA